MTAIILYTDTDAIRSAMGIDDADMEDAMFTGQQLENQMLEDLDTLRPAHATEIFSGSASLQRKLSLWCMWFGALRIAQSPLATPKRISTGKDELERFVVNWQALEELAKRKLAELDKALSPTVPESFTMMGKATPDSNPITNT